MLFNFFKNKKTTTEKIANYGANEMLYKLVVRDLEDSKYGGVTTDEEEFIVMLMQKLEQNKERKPLKLHRLSDKTINVSYDSYPIGKIRLQGRNTSMQILLNLYDFKVIRDCTNQEYIEGIDLWIKYIKKLKRI